MVAIPSIVVASESKTLDLVKFIVEMLGEFWIIDGFGSFQHVMAGNHPPLLEKLFGDRCTTCFRHMDM